MYGMITHEVGVIEKLRSSAVNCCPFKLTLSLTAPAGALAGTTQRTVCAYLELSTTIAAGCATARTMASPKRHQCVTRGSPAPSRL